MNHLSLSVNLADSIGIGRLLGIFRSTNLKIML